MFQTTTAVVHGFEVVYQSWNLFNRKNWSSSCSTVTGLLTVDRLLVAKIVWTIQANEEFDSSDYELVVFSGALRKLVESARPGSLRMLPESIVPDFALLMIFSAFAVHDGPKDEKYALIDFVCRKGFLQKYKLKKAGSRILFRPSDVAKTLKRQSASMSAKALAASPSLSVSSPLKG